MSERLLRVESANELNQSQSDIQRDSTFHNKIPERLKRTFIMSIIFFCNIFRFIDDKK
mgnify:CR=1 FL=1